jgi:hypothetical protein
MHYSGSHHQGEAHTLPEANSNDSVDNNSNKEELDDAEDSKSLVADG